MFQALKRLLFVLIVSVCVNAQAQGDFSVTENDGFCKGGAPSQAAFVTWGSYCKVGDKSVGRAVTQMFRLMGPFDIYLSGSPAWEGLSLKLENVTDGQSLSLRPDRWPGAAWLRFEFEIPDSWRGKDLRIVAEDRSTASMGWLAISAPSTPRRSDAISDAKRILLKTPLFVFLIFLPGFAFAALAVSRGIHGTVKLGLVMLAGIAIPGYVLFFVYVLSAKAGLMISAVLPFLFGAALTFFLFRFRPAERRLLRPFLIPLGLVFFSAMGILSLGYLYNGGMSAPNVSAWTRFSHPLPTDNAIPFLFAEGLLKGNVPKPLMSDWLSSDRPPLQTGMVLALEPWMKSFTRHELWYHVTALIAQSLWMFAVWLLLRAFRIAQVTTGLVIATIYLSGFTIVNTFFVWPKLLAAAYMVAFATPILAALPQAGRGSWPLRFLMGFLLACSLLSHGGTLFALLGLGLYMLIRFRRQMVKETCLVGAVTLLFYLPWMSYQKFVDPPGDRLLKYHLAGVEQITREPVLKTIVEAYARLTLNQWLGMKRADIEQVFGHEVEYWRSVAEVGKPQAKAKIRMLEFFFFLPAVSFAIFGVVGLVLGWRRSRGRREMQAAGRLLLWSFLTPIPWILMMFGVGNTPLHEGAYAMELMAMAGGVLALRAVAPWVATVVCVVSWIVHWTVYQPDLSNVAFPDSLAFRMNHWMMALHVASLCGFFAVLVAVAWKVRRGSRGTL